MRILVNNKWLKDFLDYYKSGSEYRIKVLAFKNIKKLEGVYFVREKSLKTLYNYFKKFGLKAVARKATSRLQEKWRNEKYLSFGIGKILETDNKAKFKKGELVGFIAPLFPKALERIVLKEELIFKVEKKDFPFLKDTSFFYLALQKENSAILKDKFLATIQAWSPYSGIDLKNCSENLTLLKNKARAELESTNWQKSREFFFEKDTEIREKTSPKLKKSYPHSAVLFGYGHYAKTNIIPNIKPIKLVSIHEIDPLQMNLKKPCQWDTSPYPREEEKYNVFFIAGFHHTHAEIATFALTQDAYAVIEKPVATEMRQLEKLLSAMRKSKGEIFSAFHKRYSPLNKYIQKDLKKDQNTPISYYAIVYEVPQPPFHWYRWPNSKSEITANGCHWIDHFLFLNNFSEPRNYGVSVSSDFSTFNAWIELKNRAFFTMTLTNKGSEYIGVQDYVELRTKDKTIKIIDDSIYEAQDKKGIIRKAKINKMKNYQAMYRTITKKIINQEKGDSIKSTEISTRLILELEEKLKAKTQPQL